MSVFIEDQFAELSRDYDNLANAARELLASIDKRWEGESQRKIDNAIPPRQQEAMDALRDILNHQN